VANALSSPLSIIEGPPGTGKTQTILNIIACAIMRGESVAAVSSNNSATANILEKLQKYNAGFVAALLGNSDNKREFIESQKPLPDLLAWKLSPERGAAVRQQLQTLFVSLERMLVKKNELSRLKQELDGLELEYRHFTEYYNESGAPVDIQIKNSVTPYTALQLWLMCERSAESAVPPNWFERLKNRFWYGIRDKAFRAISPQIVKLWCVCEHYTVNEKIPKRFHLGRNVTDKAFYGVLPETMVALFQKRYYEANIQELTVAVSALYTSFEAFDFDARMREYSSLSAEVFRDKLAEKYGSGARKQFDSTDLWKNSEEFIAAYPVILSTTYSLRSSLSSALMYDYVLIDESSQVDLATGALALSCAKKAVIRSAERRVG
ncbi:AAA domain-containing protein, partial [Treponema endosymbiont of Eucomonympha sp.]|uniref:AAA domain-containing protein n=1 Tax=Treponema endosymbiont of Eucomonympha sp. TaxID=1580831 RepID=UPI0016509266